MASNRSSIPLDGYPSPGALDIKLHWCGDHFGPGANTTGANYVTGGYTLTAAQFGMQAIEFAEFNGLDASGNYIPYTVMPTANASTPTEFRAPAANNVTVQWFNANGTQVANNTNLSAEVARLLVIGI